MASAPPSASTPRRPTGARKWNDANALAISLRATSEAELAEILDAWFGGEPSGDAEDAANVEHISEIEGR